MKNLLKKFRENKKGFTLAELLVVVAIVGILVAISIPVFTAQLGKAREATNNANLRAAKAAAVSMYLTDENKNAGSGGTYEYTVSTGEVKEESVPSSASTKVEINGTNVEKAKLYTKIYVKVTTAAADANETVELYPITE